MIFEYFRKKRQEKEETAAKKVRARKAFIEQEWKAEFFNASGDSLGFLYSEGLELVEIVMDYEWDFSISGHDWLLEQLRKKTISIGGKIYNTAGMSMSRPVKVYEEDSP